MRLPLDDNLLALTALVTTGFQLTSFFIAYTCQFDKITDLAGTSNFALVAILTFFLGGNYFTRQIVNSIMVLVWALRLGSFLLYRVCKRDKDARFDEFRANFFLFLGFWIFQIFWVWIVSLPLIFLNASSIDAPLGISDYVGWALWGFGFLFEAAGDYSKQFFNNNPENKGAFLKSGVWSISRHPNYAGEIILWTGLFISCSTAFAQNGNTQGFAGVLSPVYTFIILMFLSGVNLAEKRYNEKYGTRDDYLIYRNKTSPLLPVPNFIYKVLPHFIKLLCCCEFKLYEEGLPAGGGILNPQGPEQHVGDAYNPI